MNDPLLESYESIPYGSRAVALSDIARIEAVALLHGLEPSISDSARVLELGCATGGNLIAMAYRFPHAQFAGIDLSPSQVAAGQKDIDTLGLKNIELRAMSILDVTAELGLFDYIICHGVYSWVPPDVQEAILRTCQRNLVPNGIAYVSYNTYPGWHAREMARDIMVSHDDTTLDPRARIQRAHAFLEVLAASARTHDPRYAEQLRFELEMLRGYADAYFLHEQLEAYNSPLYFTEFVERAGAHGLRFVAEARLGDLEIAKGPWVEAVSDPSDYIRIQQYRDYSTGRAFRASLLCHDALVPLAEPDPAAVTTLRVSLRAERKVHSLDDPERGSLVVSYVTPGGAELVASDQVSTAALQALDRIAPVSLSFHDLLQRTNDAVSVNEPPGFVVDRRRSIQLATALLNAAYGGAIELTRHASILASAPSERPIASMVARVTPDHADTVSDLLHRHVSLRAPERAILRMLDGSNDRQAILERLEAFIADGTIQIEGEPLSRQALVSRIDTALRGFARAALLEA